LKASTRQVWISYQSHRRPVNFWAEFSRGWIPAILGWVRVLPPSLLCAALLLTSAGPAWATQAGEKRAQRRAEAERALDQVKSGVGGVESAAARIHYLGEEEYANDVLIRALRTAFEDSQRRNLAFALSLLAVGSAEPTLAKLTGEDDAVVRMYALQGLIRVKSRAAEKVVPLLADASMPVRREAARALGQMGQPRTSRPLIQAVKSEGEPEVRAAMLVAIGQTGDRKAVKTLEGFLTSSSESTRFAAARGLCLLGAPAGITFARRLLASTDRYERRHGLELFEGAPASRVQAELKPLLEDADRRLAAATARILYQGGDKKMIDWLVVASYQASGEAKLAFETELERLHLADTERKAILRRNGIGVTAP